MQIKYSYPNAAIKMFPNHCKTERIFTSVAIGKEENSSKKKTNNIKKKHRNKLLKNFTFPPFQVSYQYIKQLWARIRNTFLWRLYYTVPLTEVIRNVTPQLKKNSISTRVQNCYLQDV